MKRNRIFESTLSIIQPVDRIAKRVSEPGEHEDSKKRIVQLHWENQPPLKPRPSGFPDLTPVKYGRFVVVGFFGLKKRRKGSLWVVRCTCGRFETRWSSIIEKAKDPDDCCQRCRHVKFLKRLQSFREAGRDIHET